MGDLGKSIISIGIILIILGVLITVVSKMPGIGKLPGDFFIKKENFSFYFPITTCILISIFLSIVMHFLGKK